MIRSYVTPARYAAVFALLVCGALNAQSALGNASPREIVELSPGSALFVANSGRGLAEIYRTDGSASGATALGSFIVTDEIPSPGHLVVAGSNQVFFTADDGSGTGTELWWTDGTGPGTRLVGDLLVGPTSSFPQDLVTLPTGAVVFSAATTGHGREPWVANGNGAVRLADIRPGPAGSDPRHLVVVGSQVFFTAEDGQSGRELWVTDGTSMGTRQVRDIHPGAPGSSPNGLFSAQSKLWFCAQDGIHGFELWQSDGSSVGTTMVADIHPGAGSSQPGEFESAFGAVFFTAHDGQSNATLYTSDGTTAGTGQLVTQGVVPRSPSNLTMAAGRLWFVGEEQIHGAELWSSNGTGTGTSLVADIRPGSHSSRPDQIVELDGSNILFVAEDGTRGRELWRASALGASLVREIYPGALGARITGMHAAGGMVLFGAQASDGSGHELFRTDGNGGGTLRLEDLNVDAEQLTLELNHTVNPQGTQVFEFLVGGAPWSVIAFATRAGPGIDLNALGIASYGTLGLDPNSILFFLGIFITGQGSSSSGGIPFYLPSNFGIDVVAQAASLNPVVLSGVTTISTGPWDLTQCPSCLNVPLRATKSFYLDDTYEYDLAFDLPTAQKDIWLRVIRVSADGSEEQVELRALRPGTTRVRNQVELRRRERLELRVYCGSPDGPCYSIKALGC